MIRNNNLLIPNINFKDLLVNINHIPKAFHPKYYELSLYYIILHKTWNLKVAKVLTCFVN